MSAKDALDARIAELEQTYAQTENTISTSSDPKRVDAAIRYLAGCGTELARVRAQRAALDR
jgi:hypothetical protein